MRKTPAGIFFFIFLSFQSSSQLLSCTPDFSAEAGHAVTKIVNALKENYDLLNYSSTSDVYVHAGVITKLSPAIKAGDTENPIRILTKANPS